MGESGILAGVVQDGAESVSSQTAAPEGVDVMVSLPGKSDGTGVSGAAGAAGTAGTGVVAVRKISGIDDGAVTAAAIIPAVRRQQRRRRARVSIDEAISGMMRLRFRPGGVRAFHGFRVKPALCPYQPCSQKKVRLIPAHHKGIGGVHRPAFESTHSPPLQTAGSKQV